MFKNKKIFGLLFILIFCFINITQKASAADKYFFWDQYNGVKTEHGNLSSTGFTNKTDCEASLAKIKDVNKNVSNYTTSGTCYTGGDVKITNFTPSSAKYKDTITINGDNFLNVTKIYIGNISSLIGNQNNPKSITFTIPAAAITSDKIIVETELRGKATSSTNLNITTTNDIRWWYYNNTGQVMGPGRREAVGFTDFNTCDIARKKFINDSGSVSMKLDPCFQETITNIEEIIKKEKENMNKNDVVIVKTQKDTPDANTEYKLLAPIPGMEVAPKNIGDYFNIIFKIAIGFCAVLAVIMIVLGGIQYMGDESVFGKTEAKSQIFKAILGLLIAIGSYALLNTINPAMLGTHGLNVKQVSGEIQDETETTPWEGTSSGDNSTLCPEGYVNVPTSGTPSSINVCKSASDNLTKMLEAAKTATPSIILSGSGSRTRAEQQALRVKNGCADETLSSSKCTPPTAQPGHSNHESGKAIDFKCNGETMMSSGGRDSECFKWLSKNAITYGFKNLASEPWHWSTGSKAGH